MYFPDSFYSFINDNKNQDSESLILNYKDKITEFDSTFAVLQIKAQRKYKGKFGNFFKYGNFLVPDLLACEQSTHQAVATYHKTLIQGFENVLDMTAGLGIDSFSLADSNKKVTAIEMNRERAEILNHNAESLGLENLNIINDDSIEWLKNSHQYFDIIFIDPARRDSSNNKVFKISDCEPDVLKNKDLLLSYADMVLIKGSPLLDIKQIIRDFGNLISISAISVNGECKEILICLSKNHNKFNPEIISCLSIDLDKSGSIKTEFSFSLFYDEKSFKSDSTDNYTKYISNFEALSKFKYLYEPNSTVMKFMPWNSLNDRYPGLVKISSNTHLFLGNTYHKDFPGRVLTIENLIKKNDRKTLKDFPVSIVVRNYPVDAEKLRRQLKVKEGSEMFLYAFRLQDKNPAMLLCHLKTSLPPSKTLDC